MNRKAPRGSTPRRGATRGSIAKSGKRPQAQPKKSAAKKISLPDSPPQQLPPIHMGFVRGVAPSKWADRWNRSVREQPLEIVPVGLNKVREARANLDLLLERVGPGGTPPESDASNRTRHAMRLYEETVSLVLPSDHELSELNEISLEELTLIPLIDHPDHFAEWPPAQAWKDPTWMPQHAKATLQLVATGLGGALMAQPLARHISDKRDHVVIPVTHNGEPLLPGTEIWATWNIDRDANDIQRLVGVLRGRTARSSR